MWKGKGAEMIRVDLEAAGIISRDAHGELITLDEYGLSYDFHGLRHTFATLLNNARIPLVTAQKLMRHSDPKLTANIYTHVMNDAKAEALAKLPEIAPVTLEKEAMGKTGTTDASFMDVSFFRDRKRDSFCTDSHGQITTCVDGNAGHGSCSDGHEHEKSPVPQGETGEDCWSQLRDSNPGPVLYESTALPLSQVGLHFRMCYTIHSRLDVNRL